MILIAILILYSCDLCVKISKFSLYSHIVPQTFDKREISHFDPILHSTWHMILSQYFSYKLNNTCLLFSKDNQIGTWDSPQFYCHTYTSLDNIDIVKWSQKKYLNYASIINEDRAKREILSFLIINLTRKKL